MVSRMGERGVRGDPQFEQRTPRATPAHGAPGVPLAQDLGLLERGWRRYLEACGFLQEGEFAAVLRHFDFVGEF